MEPRDQDGHEPADGTGPGDPTGGAGGYGGYRGTGDGDGHREPGAGRPARDMPGGGGSGFASGTPDALQLCAWERREQYGFLNALYVTTREVLLGPQKFFRRMPTGVGLTQPLLYALILGVSAAFLGWIWSLAGSSLQGLLSHSLGRAFSGPLWYFVAFVGSPVTVVIVLFVRSALMHLMLRLLGGNQLGFEATFRVAAYGQAAGIVMLIPFCGGVVALFAELVIDIVGLYSIHGTDPWRAMVAVLAPALICVSGLGAVLAVALISLGLT